MKKYFYRLGIASLLGCALLSCRENAFGTVDLTLPDDPSTKQTYVFEHPCALYSKADFNRIRAAIAEGSLNPASAKEWELLKANRYVNGDWGVKTHEHTQIVRGSAVGTDEGVENYADAMKDAAAAYQFGLLWQLTRDEQYAKKAVTILNAWVKTCREVWAADNNYFLAAGAQGFTFALAGEEVRDYEGWSETEFKEFKDWMLRVFADKNEKFLRYHGNASCGEPKHYMSNWDLVNLCSYFQIGILTENSDIINYVIDYYTRSGDGLGAIPNNVQYVYDFTCPDGSVEKVAQAQESGRDQGHATMVIAVSAQLSQAAWALYESNPQAEQLDLFKTNDQALLMMAEYNALANMKTGTHDDIVGREQGGTWLYPLTQIPFTPAGPWCTGSNHEAGRQQLTFGEEQRGNLRPGWEILYKHYKNTPGSYFIKRYAEIIRPECGSGDDRYTQNSGGFDQIGWGTLMLYQE